MDSDENNLAELANAAQEPRDNNSVPEGFVINEDGESLKLNEHPDDLRK